MIGWVHRAPVSASYPGPSGVVPANPVRSPSGGSAETLVLIALILQVIGAAILIVGLGVLFGFSVLRPFRFAALAVTVAVSIAVVALVFLYCAYEFSYRHIQRGEYYQAKTPTLVIGILSLFVGVIPGIFYLVGYVKLDDAIREQQGFVGGYGPGHPTLSPGTPHTACLGCGRVYPVGQFLFCPACGKKLGA